MDQVNQHDSESPNTDTRQVSGRWISRVIQGRSLIYVAIAVLLVWIGLLIIPLLQKQNLKAELEATTSQLQNQSSALANLTTPDKIEKGQIDSALGYIITTSRDPANSDAIKLPSRSTLHLIKPFDSQWRQDVNQLDRATEIENARNSLLIHHASVLEAVGQVLRYNPQADIPESLSSDEITARITAAQEGISDAKNSLEQLQPYSEADDLQAISEALEELISNLGDFARTRDKNAWYKAVDAAQDKIIANRQSSWTTERDSLLTEYAEVQQNYSTVINRL